MTPLSSDLPGRGDVSLATTFEEGQDRRREVLEAAARLLAEEGPHALSLRRIAAEAGGSTQIVYTLFGGKPGLADALYTEGFGRLASRMREALETAPPSGDPERLVAVGRAYRDFALAEPAFFAVMFGRAIPGFTPTRTTRSLGRECTFGQVIAEVQACLDAGTLVGRGFAGEDCADQLARLCWLSVHGLASLEAAGMIAPEDPAVVAEFVEHVLRTPLLAHRP
jgi:AcrR family transcriptional regulator